MRSLSLAAGCLVAVVLSLMAGDALADTIVSVDASTVVCTPERSDFANSTWDGSGGLGYFNEGGTMRKLAYEWDISGVTVPAGQQITGAYVRVYEDNYKNNPGVRLDFSASLLSPAGITTLTWNNLPTTKTQTALDSLGHLVVASSSASTWYDTDAASAADTAKLEALRTSTGLVTMLLNPGLASPTMGGVEFGYTAGQMPQLVLTVGAVPEPSTIILVSTGLLGLLAYAWRKRK
jgi:hypothetical protein